MRAIRFVLLVAVVALMGACSGDGSSPTTTAAADDSASADDATITIVSFSYTGATSIPVGTTVTVTNEDTVNHTWTSEDDLFDSGSLSTGDSFEYTFEVAGEYMFMCNIHPGMAGSITVEG